jgi:phosphoglycerate dehydrogenase-like enzyme
MTVVPAMRRLNVLFMPHPAAIDPSWGDDVVAAIAGSHELRVFDPEREAGPQFEGVEVIVDLGGNISGELVDAAADAGVRFIQAQTNGLDHVEVDRILDAGLLLCHCPGHLSGVALADRAMMFLLMLAHRYDEGRRTFMRGELYSPNGMEPEGRSLAIIGFGNSGQLLARRARAFGMRILAIDVRPIEQRVLDELQPEFLGGPDDLDGVVARCDFVSPHLHLTDETRNIIDRRRIGLMKPTACIINVARGELIDEEALYEALLAGRLGGAGLDVFADEPADANHPVFRLPNVYVSPHTAGGTDGTSRNRARFALENLNRYARGEALEAVVER